MPPKINEALIEDTCLQQLQAVGWRHEYGKNLPTADGDFARGGMAGVVFTEQLRQAVARLNPDLPPEAVDEVVRVVTKSEIGDLLERNRAFYALLRNGVPVSYRVDGEAKSAQAMLVDFEDPQANSFIAVNQLEIRGTRGKRIPDVILFVNGLPLVVLELKHPLSEKADLQAAFNQLQTYKAELPDLFVFNQLLVISDGTEARIGSLSADWQRFTPWRVVDEAANSARLPFVDELAGVVEGLLRPETLLDYLRFFVLFERGDRGQMVKKCAAYHQFYGVNAAVAATLSASGAEGDGRIGVMWHTQGSGKSISMLFYAGKLLAQRALQNPTLVVVTDRSDLDGQLFQTFSAGQELLKQEPVQADSREALRQALAERAAGGVFFTTMQKFAPREDEERFPALSTRRNIIVISDEAHRSQYGFALKVGSGGQMRAGYARHLRDALPNASFIGFTGTPLSLDDKDTQEVFGRYVSVYDLQDAVNDGATVPIVYEARQIRLNVDAARLHELFEDLDGDADEASAKLRLREHILGSDARLRDLAADLVAHFAQRNQVAPGKAMVVAVSRRVCVDLYNHLIALRPDWHSDEVNGGALKIVMTGSAGDPPEFQPHLYSREEKKTLEKRFKDPDDPLQMVIVRDMWLTGFDAPCCHTMYLDKPMQGHNLMQAIARVNRVFKNKSRDNGGLIVDYIGLTDELKKATQRYSRDGGKGEMTRDIGAVFAKMQEHLEVVRGQFATPVNGRVFAVQAALAEKDPQALLAHIRRAAEHILALDHAGRDLQRKKAFLDNVRLAKKGFALCGALAETAPYREELAFYDAVRAVLAKRDGGGTGGDRLLQLTALINQSIVSEGVIDLFDLLGKPQARLDLLSDDFLQTVQTSDTPHLWVAAAERYLQAKIRETAGNNLAAQKDFSERLQEALNRYNNHNLSVIEVLEELVNLARELQEHLARGEKLGLSEAELAFYDALARNDSARELMSEVVLVALAKEITETLRGSVSIDWKFKDAAKARMRLLVKRALKRYKYPPDAEAAAIDFVLQQAETTADDWAV